MLTIFRSKNDDSCFQSFQSFLAYTINLHCSKEKYIFFSKNRNNIALTTNHNSLKLEKNTAFQITLNINVKVFTVKEIDSKFEKFFKIIFSDASQRFPSPSNAHKLKI